jgi:Glu-tRNA(Gln) amidotransferase subunit E-like FAD-binding protein
MLDLLLLPFELVRRLLEAIKEEVDREMLNTIDSIKKRMIEIELLYTQGKISREEFEEVMEALTDRLKKLEELG